MARIITKDLLTDYIKMQLGAPLINIEVSDAQIHQIIDDTIQRFTEYAYGTLEAVSVLDLDGPGEYDMPEHMTNVLKLSKGSTSNIANFATNFGSGYVPDIWSQQYFSSSFTGDITASVINISTTKSILDKFFDDGIVYNFNPYKNKLQVLENFIGKAVIHYQYEYVADDSGDGIFNHEWVKAYSTAKTKLLWGTITGKYDQSLVGGARINYNDIKSEAQTEIDYLNEQLLNKWSDPCPIDVG